MSILDIQLAGPSNNVPQDDPQRTLNWYSEKTGDTWTLKPTPGAIESFNLAVNGGGRGAISLGGRLFGVRGAFFQEIVDGTAVVRGTLESTQGALEIQGVLPPDGSGQIIIVDQANGYVFEFDGDVFTLLTEADHGFVGGLGQVAIVSGYAVVIKPGTNQVGFSSLYNLLDWPGTNFFTAESTKGNLVALVSTGSTVFLFTDSGFEGWTTEGYTPPFAFTLAIRDFQIGCSAPASLVSFDRWIYWLGGNIAGKGVVYSYTQGGTPTRITDHSTERQIAAIADPSDAVGYCYQSLGHVFYVLSFQTGNETICWDKTTDYWHDRAWRDPLTNYMFAVPYITMVIHDGVLLGLDRRNGKFYEVSNTAYADAGAPIRRERTLAVMPAEADWMTVVNSVELFGEIGNAPVPTQTVTTNVISGTSIAQAPIILTNPLARYIHIGYYLGTETWIAFAFASAAARANYLAGLAVDGFMGLATGSFDTGAAPIIIRDGADNALVQFILDPVNLDNLPFSFDILENTVQVDNNPRIMLQYSIDRGKTYGQELWQQAGGNYSYAARTRWVGLGAGFGFTFKFAIVCNQYVSWRSIRVNAE